VHNSTQALVAEVFDAMNAGELERIRDLVTDDFIDHGSPVPLPPGPDGYIAILTFVTTVLHVQYEVDDIVAAGDMVAIRATAHGVNAVSPPGIEVTGSPFAMKTAHFFRSRDGRLTEHWGIRDELDVLYQVGALVPPDVAVGRSSAWTVERLTGRDTATALRPLFREYLNWFADQLRDHHQVHFDEPDGVVIERHHRAFDAALPDMLSGRGRVIVARTADEIVGVGTLKPVDDVTAEIKRVFVRPDMRGHGIGRDIMDRLLRDARAEGYTAVRGETMGFMDSAIALYRSLGTVETAQFDGSETAAAGLEELTQYLEIALTPGSG